MAKKSVNKCNWDVLDARYVDEGNPACSVDHKNKRAIFRMEIRMKDKEALDQIAPCMKTKVKPYIHRGERYWIVYRYGVGAKEILDKLPRTSLRREKDNITFQRCKQLWDQGYSDSIPPKKRGRPKKKQLS